MDSLSFSNVQSRSPFPFAMRCARTTKASFHPLFEALQHGNKGSTRNRVIMSISTIISTIYGEKSPHMTEGEVEMTQSAVAQKKRLEATFEMAGSIVISLWEHHIQISCSNDTDILSRQDVTSLSQSSSETNSETITRPRYQSNLPQRRRGRFRARCFLRWH